jgi:hypothetical protein
MKILLVLLVLFILQEVVNACGCTCGKNSAMSTLLSVEVEENTDLASTINDNCPDKPVCELNCNTYFPEETCFTKSSIIGIDLTVVNNSLITKDYQTVCIEGKKSYFENYDNLNVSF